jgi:L-seryl-tRNA(Ser) seleniumtransferase
VREIPALAMLTATGDDVRARARRACDALVRQGLPCTVRDTEASVGGGAFPSARIASAAVAIAGDAPALERRLRAAPVPVIGRIEERSLLLDLRSVPASLDDALVAAIAAALA